ncbi:hypothetical protein CFIMG_008312RA00001 [Ceratocystis fimbriata CBS 114723]|uniref:Uncharacterized protein n=1 Tax=Ceratocystis fimbriata CBS 114723 TaxID=1035309 RepID=A0A2C5WZI1_9PEZI|nr:hypothetical protein CFIMG_008312RA00001 [Ceratocystis fimbriata CBS 114723]
MRKEVAIFPTAPRRPSKIRGTLSTRKSRTLMLVTIATNVSKDASDRRVSHMVCCDWFTTDGTILMAVASIWSNYLCRQ